MCVYPAQKVWTNKYFTDKVVEILLPENVSIFNCCRYDVGLVPHVQGVYTSCHGKQNLPSARIFDIHVQTNMISCFASDSFNPKLSQPEAVAGASLCDDTVYIYQNHSSTGL